ncbi:alpha/beta fold hydrolase [Pontibacter qinzhouensis]|uniref:Alpha/beta fold hydrolase n=2 Tax=Pontibacter qinzhouensis TaxID=2603253 RepID=A0A5C8JKP0_9BACT|nr:alpha/beta fold hydrolase [Pontibacter qinzhouensis]
MFQFLKLPPQLPFEHLDWIAPLSLQESLAEYAGRLKAQITAPTPILIGLSFGGVIAIELAKLLQPRKLIIISSLAQSAALPWYYRALGKLKLQRYIPLKVLQSFLPLAPFFFGAHSPAEKKLLRQVILDIDENYLRWALEQLLAWRQKEPLPNLLHLHGTADKVLPLRQRPGMYIVKGGEHLMVMDRAPEISAILHNILTEDL